MAQEQASSNSKIPVIAILDIGKTNKKVLLFDAGYKIVYERIAQLPETTDEEGYPCEDVHALEQWVGEEIRKVQSLEGVKIRAINISAYGASLVHLDKDNKSLGHICNYLKPYPTELLQSFMAAYDNDQLLSLQTASPLLGNLNSGLQLYRLKRQRPSYYQQIKYSLHLPQHLTFLLTGKPQTELTSIGCHTMLWDYGKGAYHDWVIKETLTSKFPEIVSSTHVNENAGTMVGVGLHDSSAALIPYLSASRDQFVLISTGTWCISLNPFNTHPLTKEELDLDCLQYLSYEGRSVKASRLFAGHEHEMMLKKISSHFNVDSDTLRALDFDKNIAADLIHASQIKNEVPNRLGQQGSGFDQRPIAGFKSAAEAYHQLMIDIVRQQMKSTALVLQKTGATKIFVDGGFSTNSIYMNLLAAGFHQYDVCGATVAQASALGAALAIHSSWNPHPMSDSIIKLRPWKKPAGIEIQPIT